MVTSHWCFFILIFTLLSTSLGHELSPLSEDEPDFRFVQETQVLLEAGFNVLRNLEESSRAAILVMGNTGAGKTTGTLLIAGNNSQIFAYKDLGGNILIQDFQHKISSGGYTMVSKTIFPDLVHDSDTNAAFFDFPGFQDTRNASVEIANSVFMKKVTDHTERVKILLVIKHSSLKPGENRVDFKNLISHTMKFIKDVSKFTNGIALLVSKVEVYDRNKTDEAIIQDLAQFMRNGLEHFPQIFKNPEKLRNAQALVSALLVQDQDGDYPKISIIRQPMELPVNAVRIPLSELPQVQKCRKRIRSMVFQNIEFVPRSEEDFGNSLSPAAHLVLNKLADTVYEQTEDAFTILARELYTTFQHHLNRAQKDVVNNQKVSPRLIVEWNLLNNYTKGAKALGGFGTSSQAGEINNIDIFLKTTNTLVNQFDLPFTALLNQNLVKQLEFLVQMTSKTPDFRRWLSPFEQISYKMGIDLEKLQSQVRNVALSVKLSILNSATEIGLTVKAQYAEKSLMLFRNGLEHAYYYFYHASQRWAEMRRFHRDSDFNLNSSMSSSELVHSFVKTVKAEQLGLNRVFENHWTSFQTQTEQLEFLQYFLTDSVRLEPSSLSPLTINLVSDTVQNISSWFNFLVQILSKFSEFDVQKNRLNYNVADLKDWGKVRQDSRPGITITRQNLPHFQRLLQSNTFNIFATIENLNSFMNDQRLEELAQTLDWTIDHRIEYECVQSEGKLTVKGTFILLSEISQLTANFSHFSCSQQFSKGTLSINPIKILEIYALHTVFIDTDIKATGKKLLLSIIAPKWEIVGNRIFVLDGANGTSQEKASKGTYYGADGSPGQQGLPGGAAGSFLGISMSKYGGSLKITANGGQGGAGQKGGDGADGKPGREPQLPATGVQYPYDDYWYLKSTHRITIPTGVYNQYGYYFYYAIRSKDFLGGAGGRGGTGGAPGHGGNPGRIIDITLNDPSDTTPKIMQSQINIENAAGKFGARGLGGLGGREGRSGSIFIGERDTTVHTTVLYIAPIIWKTTYEWRKYGTSDKLSDVAMYDDSCFFPVPELTGVIFMEDCESESTRQEKRKTDNEIQQTRRIQNGAMGSPGSDSEIRSDVNVPEASPSTDPFSPIALQFKLFNIKHISRVSSFSGSQFFHKFLHSMDSNRQTLDLSTVKSFVKEMEAIETAIGVFTSAPSSSQVRFIPLLESLMYRIELYGSSTAATSTMETRKVLSYVYTAALGTLIRIRDSLDPAVVVNIRVYLSLVQEDLNLLQHRGAKMAVDKTLKQYYKEIQDKMDEAQGLVQDHILTEVDSLQDQMEGRINALIDQAIEYEVAAKMEQRNLKALEKQLQKTVVLQKLLGFLKTGSQLLFFAGPKGAAVGAVAGGAATIAKGIFIQDKPISQAVHIPEGVISSLTTLEVAMVRERRQKRQQLQRLIKMAKTELEKFPTLLNKTLEAIEKIDAEMPENRIDHGHSSLNVNVHVDLNELTHPDLEKVGASLQTTLWNADLTIRSHLGGRTEGRAQDAQKALNHVRSGLLTFQAGITAYNDVNRDKKKLEYVGAAINASQNKIDMLIAYQDRVYKELVPLLGSVRGALHRVEKVAQKDSKSHLDVTHREIQGYLKNFKKFVQEFTEGFSVGPELSQLIDKLMDGMSVMIKIYDRIETYAEHNRFAGYIAQLAMPQSLELEIQDADLREGFHRLEFIIQSNVVLQGYERAIQAFQQWIFPFGHLFMEDFQLPKSMELPRIVNNGNVTSAMSSLIYDAKVKVKNLGRKLTEWDMTIKTKLDTYQHHGEFPEPFFTWNGSAYSDQISDFLDGKEILLVAFPPQLQSTEGVVTGHSANHSSNVQNLYREKEAVKFNSIGIQLTPSNLDFTGNLSVLEDFKLSLTHTGFSWYAFKGRYYRMMTPSLHMSFPIKQGTQGVPSGNGVTRKIFHGDQILSPYCLWKLQLQPSKREANFNSLSDFKGRMDLNLVGSGSWIEDTIPDELQMDTYYGANLFQLELQ